MRDLNTAFPTSHGNTLLSPKTITCLYQGKQKSTPTLVRRGYSGEGVRATEEQCCQHWGVSLAQADLDSLTEADLKLICTFALLYLLPMLMFDGVRVPYSDGHHSSRTAKMTAGCVKGGAGGGASLESQHPRR